MTERDFYFFVWPVIVALVVGIGGLWLSKH